MDFIKAQQRLDVLGAKCSENIDAYNHYIKSYPLLLKSSSQICESLGADAIPVIAHLAYGWMPTILSFHFNENMSRHLLNAYEVNNFQSGLSIVNALKFSPVNNSWVGLSKVLHFMNPEIFPIWDSKVAKNFGVSGHYKMKQKDIYIQYMKFVFSKLDLKVVSGVQQAFVSQVGYEVSQVRACEFILFTIAEEKL